MKAAVLTALRQLEITDIPEPTIKNDTDVLLKIEAVGVCGSDVHYYENGKIGSQVVQYPYLLGHECSATVQAIGTKVNRVKVDEQVVVDPAVSCGLCDQCKMGRENTCRELQFLGTPGQGPGCLCEYIVISQNSCFATNGAVTVEQSILCEPLAIGIYCIKRSRLQENARIAILGSGPIGLSCMAAARAVNAKDIYMTDKIDERVQIAENAGATWVGNPVKEDIAAAITRQVPLGIDVVYECAGQQDTLDQAIELLRPGGVLMLIGAPEFDRVWFVIDKMRRKEITLMNVRRQNDCTQAAIDLIASGKVNVDFMITHRFKFEDSKKAFDIVSGYRDGVIKAIIEL